MGKTRSYQKSKKILTSSLQDLDRTKTSHGGFNKLKRQKPNYYKALQIAASLTPRFIDEVGSMNGHLPGCVCDKCNQARDFIRIMRGDKTRT